MAPQLDHQHRHRTGFAQVQDGRARLGGRSVYISPRRKEQEQNRRGSKWAYDTFECAFSVGWQSATVAIELIRDAWDQSSTSTILYFVITFPRDLKLIDARPRRKARGGGTQEGDASDGGEGEVGKGDRDCALGGAPADCAVTVKSCPRAGARKLRRFRGRRFRGRWTQLSACGSFGRLGGTGLIYLGPAYSHGRIMLLPGPVISHISELLVPRFFVSDFWLSGIIIFFPFFFWSTFGMSCFM